MSDIISQLKALKLHGMADSYTELQSQGATGATASMESSVWLLRHLLEAESTDRAIRPSATRSMRRSFLSTVIWLALTSASPGWTRH